MIFFSRTPLAHIIQDSLPLRRLRLKSFRHASISTLALCTLAQPSQAQAGSLPTQQWVTNAPVTNLAVVDGVAYISGPFSKVGKYTGCGLLTDPSTGNTLPSMPEVEGADINTSAGIRAAVPDGSGGYFIGGSFTKVSGVARNYIAHILSDGSVDPTWNPNANNAVFSLALFGSTLYVGGEFQRIGRQNRNYIACLDTATGIATEWNPDTANFRVTDLLVSGNTVYAAHGTYGAVSAYDTLSTNTTRWITRFGSRGTFQIFPGIVNAVALAGSSLYVGGSFDTVGVNSGTTGGLDRSNLAILDANTGSVFPINPSANALIRVLKSSGSQMYVGGEFTSIGGQPRNRLACLDPSTGTPTDWNPGADNTVQTITIAGSNVYVGGFFSNIGGASRNNAAAINAVTGSVSDWIPDPSDLVSAIAVSDSSIFVGGFFNSINGKGRNTIAALDATTREPFSWNPNPNGPVLSLAATSSTVYAGGAFTNIGGQSRNYIAALDTSIGNATPWDPNSTGGGVLPPITLRDGHTLPAKPSKVSKTTYNQLHAIGADTQTRAGETPGPNTERVYFPEVLSLAVSGSLVYAGGQFSGIGGQPRNCIAALDIVTGNATSWNPNASGASPISRIDSLTAADSTIYVRGEFTSIGGQSRTSYAAVDVSTGNATSWYPEISSTPTVVTLAVSGSTVFISDGLSVSAVDTATGNVKQWSTSTDNYAVSAVLSGSILYIGGQFTSVSGLPRGYLAALDTSTGAVLPWYPGGDAPVAALAKPGSRLYVAGQFRKVAGQGPYLAILQGSTGVYGASSFIPADDATPNVADFTDFGSVVVGTTIDQAPARTFQIKNDGTAPLTISDISLSGNEFSIIAPATFPVLVMPGSSTSLLINALPQSLGTVSTTVTVSSDDPDTPAYSFRIQAAGVSAQATTPEKVDELTSTSGWQVLGNSEGLGYDAANSAFLMTLTTGTQTRVVGWREDASTDIPYASIGTDKVARAKFAMYSVAAPGINALPTTSTVFSLPNFRIRLMQRFVINSMLEVNHNSGNTDPAVRNLAREFSPSNDPAAPSVYTVDLDPVDIPYLLGSAGVTEGVQRGVEAVGEVSPLLPDYQYVQGTLALTDSSVGTYPIPNRAQTPVKVYATGTTDFTNSDVTLTKLQLDHDPLAAGIVSGLSLETSLTLTKSTAGITVDSTLVPASKVAIAAVDFLGGNGYDQTHPESRLRIDPERLYKISFRISSTGITTSAPQIRLRARTAKFQWTHKLELGGAAAVGSAAGRAIIAEAMPGTNSQNLDADANGQWYHVWFTSPLQPNVRADVAGTMLDKFPLLMAQPGNGDPTNQSVRDLKLGFDVIDTLSFGVGYEGEVAKEINLNRIEIRDYPQPDMTVAP